MRPIFLSGLALAAMAVTASLPAHAQVTITRGGGNFNTAAGKFSQADQSATTLGGLALNHGAAITNGGNNRNMAVGKFSYAGQDTTTIGGTAAGRGRVITNGGANLNVARGFGSAATQSVLTAGGTRRRPRQVDHQWRPEHEPGFRRVLLRGPAGRHTGRRSRAAWAERHEWRAQPQRCDGIRQLGLPAGVHRGPVTANEQARTGPA